MSATVIQDPWEGCRAGERFHGEGFEDSGNVMGRGCEAGTCRPPPTRSHKNWGGAVENSGGDGCGQERYLGIWWIPDPDLSHPSPSTPTSATSTAGS